MNRALSQLHQFWQALGLNQRVSVVLSLVFVAVGMAALLMWSGRPRLALLYGNLDQEEMAEVVSAVQEQGVAYEVHGSSVMVPQDQVYTLRMQLAAKGLPRGGGVGFEIFDQGNFGISDFVQRKNYIRALQGELARTITQLNGVREARVMVVIPENRLLVGEVEAPPTASVFIDTGGQVLPSDAVNSIRFLVANSVEGLLVDNVAVVDNQGKVLSEALRTDESLAEVQGQLRYRQQLEDYYARKIESLLSKVAGPGGVVARVSAQVSTQAQTRRDVTYDPDGQVIRSQTINEDSSVSQEQRGGDVIGVASNVTGEAIPGSSTVDTSTTTDSTKNRSTTYEINQSTVEIVEAPGRIEQLTASVFIAQQANAEGAPSPRSAEEMERLRRIVGNALGIAPDQGLTNLVSIEEMPFAQVQNASLLPEPGLMDQVMHYNDFIRNFLAVAVAIAMFVIFLRMIKRYRPEAVSVGPITDFQMEPKNVTPQLTPEILNELIQSKPENVSAALRGWIEEGGKR